MVTFKRNADGKNVMEPPSGSLQSQNAQDFYDPKKGPYVPVSPDGGDAKTERYVRDPQKPLVAVTPKQVAAIMDMLQRDNVEAMAWEVVDHIRTSMPDVKRVPQSVIVSGMKLQLRRPTLLQRFSVWLMPRIPVLVGMVLGSDAIDRYVWDANFPMRTYDNWKKALTAYRELIAPILKKETLRALYAYEKQIAMTIRAFVNDVVLRTKPAPPKTATKLKQALDSVIANLDTARPQLMAFTMYTWLAELVYNHSDQGSSLWRGANWVVSDMPMQDDKATWQHAINKLEAVVIKKLTRKFTNLFYEMNPPPEQK